MFTRQRRAETGFSSWFDPSYKEQALAKAQAVFALLGVGSPGATTSWLTSTFDDIDESLDTLSHQARVNSAGYMTQWDAQARQALTGARRQSAAKAVGRAQELLHTPSTTYVEEAALKTGLKRLMAKLKTQEAAAKPATSPNLPTPDLSLPTPSYPAPTVPPYNPNGTQVPGAGGTTPTQPANNTAAQASASPNPTGQRLWPWVVGLGAAGVVGVLLWRGRS